MTRIGITGASGFIGIHLTLFLSGRVANDIEMVPFPHAAFNDKKILEGLVSSCDTLIHLAGTNKGTAEDIHNGNVELARKLVDACRETSAKPHVIFTSSIYADISSITVPHERSLVFGPAKKAAEDLFLIWEKEAGALVTILRLPHVFGELAQPFSNSVVATFCHQLARNEASVVNPDAVVELVYVGEVISHLYRAVIKRVRGEVSIMGGYMSVKTLYGHLKNFADMYRAGTIPQPADSLETALLLTLHAHILFFDDRFI